MYIIVHREDEEDDTLCDEPTPSSTAVPIPKKRTILHHNLPLNLASSSPPPLPPRPSESALHFRTSSSSSADKVFVTGTPPTPRPRPRSGEQKKTQQLEQEVKQKTNELTTARSRLSDMEGELSSAQREIDQLRQRNGGELGQGQPRMVHVEETGQRDLELARGESLKLQEVVRAREADLREKESLVVKRDSEIVGLKEQISSLHNPKDLRMRTEYRLSVALGDKKALETELSGLQKVRWL